MKARPATKCKDVVNYSSSLSNSNWRRMAGICDFSGEEVQTSRETFGLMACNKLFTLKGDIGWGHNR